MAVSNESAPSYTQAVQKGENRAVARLLMMGADANTSATTQLPSCVPGVSIDSSLPMYTSFICSSVKSISPFAHHKQPKTTVSRLVDLSSSG